MFPCEAGGLARLADEYEIVVALKRNRRSDVRRAGRCGSPDALGVELNVGEPQRRRRRLTRPSTAARATGRPPARRVNSRAREHLWL